MKRLLLIITFCWYGVAFAQVKLELIDGDSLWVIERYQLTTIVQKAEDSLKAIGIDSIINYSSYFMDIPITRYDSAGASHENRFLIWKQHDDTYAQLFVRYDINYDGHPRILRSLRRCNEEHIFSFLKLNYDSIRMEEILPFITKYVINGVEAYQPIIANHKQYDLIKMSVKGEDTVKEIPYSDQMEKLIDTLNLNYNYNQHTKLNQLYNLIIKAIGPLLIQ